MKDEAEFKGQSQYSQNVVAEVVMDLTKAISILSKIDHNFVFVDGCELEYQVLKSCVDLLSTARDNLYIGNKK